MDSPLPEPDGSIIPHILLILLEIAALASPPFRDRRTFFTVALISMFFISRVKPHFSNNPALLQPIMVNWAVFLSALEKTLTSGPQGPEGSFWRIDRPAREATAMRAFGPKKLRWAMSLVANQRGIRWNWEVKNVERAEPMGRLSFLMQQARHLVYLCFMQDIVSEIWRHFMFSSGKDFKYLSVQSAPLAYNVFWTSITGFFVYYGIQIQYVGFTIIAVAFDFCKPEDCPPFFGKVSEVTTVRHFWGQYWHQSLRKSLTSLSQSAVHHLGIKRGTNLSSYTQLWLAFAISGFLHTHPALLMPCGANITYSEKVVGTMQFFLSQAAAIMLEDFIQWAWKKAGGDFKVPSRARTLLGYAWVYLAVWFSMQFTADVLLRLRFGADQFLPYSLAARWVWVIPTPP